MTEEPKTTTVKIIPTKNGKYCVNLPNWAILRLYKMSGIRSMKLRHVNKAVKRMFLLAIENSIQDLK